MKYVAFCNMTMNKILNSDNKNKCNDGGIWIYLCSMDKPMTISEIAKHFKKQQQSIWRSLLNLIELDVVRKIDAEWNTYYEANKNTYHHTDEYYD